MRRLLTLLYLILFISNTQAQDIHFIQSSGDSIFYETAGRGKETVLFLSGGPGGSANSLDLL